MGRLLLLIAALGLLILIWPSPWPVLITLTGLVLVLLLNRVWLGWVCAGLETGRRLPERAFQGDTLTVELDIRNPVSLPLPSLQLHEVLPPGLTVQGETDWLVSLRRREQARLSYQVVCKRRGRYQLGPLQGTADTLLEIAPASGGHALQWEKRARLVVYPEIVPLERLGLPGNLPLGNVRSRRPTLTDPTRLAGLREYQAGDDPRFIDWRSTAHLNQLLVKQFEPTRLVPLAVFLDLRAVRLNFDWQNATETAVSVAASLVYRAHELKQAFGLYSTGLDRGWDDQKPGRAESGLTEMNPRTGVAWLYEVLERLAGLTVNQAGQPLETLTGHWSSGLPWGATIALVGFAPSVELAGEAVRLKRAGFSLLAIFTAQDQLSPPGPARDGLTAFRNFDIPTFTVAVARELEAISVE